MDTIGLINTTNSTWMLSITCSKLGPSSSLMLPYVVVASISPPPPPPITYEQVCSSSSFESTIDDLKVILNFFLSGEVTNLKLNVSPGVAGFIRVSINEIDVLVKAM